MADLKSGHTVVSEEMRIGFKPEEIWPLLCPVGEYDWIEHWECEMVHSLSGRNELDCVFRTDFSGEGGLETWVTSRFDPCERLEFVRVNNVRSIRLVITLEPDGNGTRMLWTQHVTPLSEAGREYVRGKEVAFKRQMALIRRFLTHYLETGEMLRGAADATRTGEEKHVHGRQAG